MSQLARVPSSVPIEDRYKVNPITGCWIFLGSVDDEGYGRIDHYMAHRVIYKKLVGPVPDHLQLDHLCVRRNCVNPEHLEIVTTQENQRRAKEYCTPAEWTRDACGKGHPFTPENTRIDMARPKGREPYPVRTCRDCERARRGRQPIHTV